MHDSCTVTVAVIFLAAAAAVIQGEKAVFVKPGSSISLSCTIALYSVPPATIAWYRDGRHLNLGSARGGVSLENEKTPQYTRSTLLVTRAAPDDSGNYTCLPSSGHPDSVTVHVLDGEYKISFYSISHIQYIK